MDDSIESQVGIIPKENEEEVPFGRPSCKICCLPLEFLKQAHAYKFAQNWSLAQISKWLKATCGISYTPMNISEHFASHVKKGYRELAIVESLNQNLQVTQEAKDIIKSNPYVNNATEVLAKLTAIVAEKFYECFVDIPISPEKFKKDFENANSFKAINSVVSSLKELRELIRDVSLIRSPQTIMVKYLEDALKSIIRACCDTFTRIILELNQEIVDAVKNKQLSTITPTSFGMLYNRHAFDMKTKLDVVARDLLNKFEKELEELAKVI